MACSEKKPRFGNDIHATEKTEETSMTSTETELVMSYFEAWNTRNIEKLCELFSNTVTLKDWEISEIGLNDVVAANRKIFESAPDIEAEVVSVATSLCGKVFAQLIIHINREEFIRVVDVFCFDQGRIGSITAYKC